MGHSKNINKKAPTTFLSLSLETTKDDDMLFKILQLKAKIREIKLRRAEPNLLQTGRAVVFVKIYADDNNSEF